MLEHLLLLACLQSPAPAKLDEATRERYEVAARYSEEMSGFSLLINHGDETVFEAYADGTNAQTAHELMSGTKSFWGVLAMAAIEDERVADTIRSACAPLLGSVIGRTILCFRTGRP